MQLGNVHPTEIWKKQFMVMKEHIFAKWEQNRSYRALKRDLEYEILTHVDYSENYQFRQQQNEI